MGKIHSEHLNLWGIFFDKWYQGALEFIREIHPRRPLKGIFLLLTVNLSGRCAKIAS